jgi:hypothetical protein
MSTRKTHDLEGMVNRREAVSKILQEESDYNTFIATKFRKPASVVVPMTAARSGGDLPISSGRDPENMRLFKAATVATPLNLPPLKVKPLRKPKRKDPTSRRAELSTMSRDEF